VIETAMTKNISNLNRAQRRALAEGVIAIPTSELFDGETQISGEMLIDRVVGAIAEQVGRITAAEEAEMRRQVWLELHNAERHDRGMRPVTEVLHHSEGAQEEGRQTMAEMLPRARKLAAESPGRGYSNSDIADEISILRLDHFESAMIYRARLGRPAGWHCDIVFSHELPTIGDTIGTPVSQPCQTREEALEWGVRTLADLIRHSALGAH